jgi:hypothetical protein
MLVNVLATFKKTQVCIMLDNTLDTCKQQILKDDHHSLLQLNHKLIAPKNCVDVVYILDHIGMQLEHTFIVKTLFAKLR